MHQEIDDTNLLTIYFGDTCVLQNTLMSKIVVINFDHLGQHFER